MSTCNQLDLQTLGSQPIMPKNLPYHWFKPKKEGSTLKPSSSTLGTREVWNSITLAYQTLFRNQRFQTCIGMPKFNQFGFQPSTTSIHEWAHIPIFCDSILGTWKWGPNEDHWPSSVKVAYLRMYTNKSSQLSLTLSGALATINWPIGMGYNLESYKFLLILSYLLPTKFYHILRCTY